MLSIYIKIISDLLKKNILNKIKSIYFGGESIIFNYLFYKLTNNIFKNNNIIIYSFKNRYKKKISNIRIININKISNIKIDLFISEILYYNKNNIIIKKNNKFYIENILIKLSSLNIYYLLDYNRQYKNNIIKYEFKNASKYILDKKYLKNINTFDNNIILSINNKKKVKINNKLIKIPGYISSNLIKKNNNTIIYCINKEKVYIK